MDLIRGGHDRKRAHLGHNRPHLRYDTCQLGYSVALSTPASSSLVQRLVVDRCTLGSASAAVILSPLSQASFRRLAVARYTFNLHGIWPCLRILHLLDGWQLQTPFNRMDVACSRCRANLANTRQSRPDADLDFQLKVLQTFQVVPALLGSGVIDIPRLVLQMMLRRIHSLMRAATFEDTFSFKDSNS